MARSPSTFFRFLSQLLVWRTSKAKSGRSQAGNELFGSSGIRIRVADLGRKLGDSLLSQAISILLCLCPSVNRNGLQQVNLFLGQTYNLTSNLHYIRAPHFTPPKPRLVALYQRCAPTCDTAHTVFSEYKGGVEEDF